MKKNTKGFTLIELLAVIVILAIIALIATPIVLNLIKTARRGAAARSAEGIRSALGKQYFANIVLHPEATIEVEPFTFTDNAENNKAIPVYDTTMGAIIDGKLPTGGIVSITADGNVTGTDLITDDYKCSFNPTGVATCSKGSTTSGS